MLRHQSGSQRVQLDLLVRGTVLRMCNAEFLVSTVNTIAREIGKTLPDTFFLRPLWSCIFFQRLRYVTIEHHAPTDIIPAVCPSSNSKSKTQVYLFARDTLPGSRPSTLFLDNNRLCCLLVQRKPPPPQIHTAGVLKYLFGAHKLPLPTLL